MQLKHLRSFVAVAHSLHFRKAAATLGITQPALSQHIAQLERDVGTPLLLRDRRSVELTASGEVLLDGARAAMTRLEEAADQARAIGEARRRTLVVGQLDYTSHAFLPRAIFQVKERFPDALVDTRDMNPDEAIIAVREGRIDLGISLRPVDAPDLVLRDVLRGKWSLVMPKGHPLASAATVPVKSLNGLDLLVFQRRINPRSYSWLMQQFEKAGFTPKVRHHVAAPQHGPALVQQGVGLFLVGDYVLSELPRGVVMRPLSGFNADITVVAAWRPGTRTPLLRAFLDGLPALV